MSPEVIGGLAGGAFGVTNMGVLYAIANRMENKRPPQRAMAGILRKVAVLDALIFAALGYFLVPMFME